MKENDYISDILSGLGLAINEKNNNEIIINYPIILDKKIMEFVLNSNYKLINQTLGTFLSDFLNTNFEDYNEFYLFFLKYSLSIIELDKFKKIFKDGKCPEKDFKKFILDLQNKKLKIYKKLQEQTDMILDYCLFNPSKQAINFKPIERLYVLRRTSPTLTLLNENKSAYYSVNLFSSYPGETEKEIYNFLSNKKNKVIEYDLIIPYDISSIIYKSICSILKEKIHLKICKNCNKYFIANIKSASYCNNIAPGETKKTCKDVGRRISFENSKCEDYVLDLYYKVYNRKSMMKLRNPDIDKYINDFNKYKEIGKKKVIQYKKGKLSSEDFKNWIEKNS